MISQVRFPFLHAKIQLENGQILTNDFLHVKTARFVSYKNLLLLVKTPVILKFLSGKRYNTLCLLVTMKCGRTQIQTELPLTFTTDVSRCCSSSFGIIVINRAMSSANMRSTASIRRGFKTGNFEKSWNCSCSCIFFTFGKSPGEI